MNIEVEHNTDNLNFLYELTYILWQALAAAKLSNGKT